MTWYVATIIQAILLKNKTEIQEKVPVFESYFLIEANSFDEAHEKAQEIGLFEQGNEDLWYCGKPAYQKFLGVRKIKTPFNPFGIDDEAQPTNGTELTYSYFEVDSLEDAQKLANGQSVNIHYIDDA